MKIDEIAVFPLSSIALPGGLLPLRIFEPRYVDMVRRCMRRKEGFVLSLLPPKPQMLDERPLPYTVGGLVTIEDWHPEPDGLFSIVVRGQSKVRLHNFRWQKDGLLLASAEYIPPEPPSPLKPEDRLLADLLKSVLEQVASDWYPNGAYEDAVWVGYRLTEFLPLPDEFRQQLLEMDNAELRLAVLMQVVHDWHTQ